MAVGDVVLFNEFKLDVGLKIHNLATSQVTPGGNYATGGPTITSTTWSNGGGVITFDGADISIASNASNPNNARWGIIYNDTSAGKEAVAFLELNGTTDLTAGLFAVAWNASGIFSLT